MSCRWLGWQGHQLGAPKVLGHIVVELLFIRRGEEVLCDGNAARKTDVLLDLLSQCAFAERLQTIPQYNIPMQLVVSLDVLKAERFGVAEHLRVDDADQSVEFHQAVLERGRGQEELMTRLQRFGDCSRRLVCTFQYVTEPVGFVDDHQIPGNRRYRILAGFGELIRTEDDAVAGQEGIWIPGIHRFTIRVRFQNEARQAELFQEFLLPLFPQGCWKDRVNSAAALGPALCDDQRRSIVLPRPTSSARIKPFDSGERSAARAASTWCGLRSTRAEARDCDNRDRSSPPPRKVKAVAQWRLW
jgi:hypothetical protein